ncbi:MAG: glycosyltransferase family 4 protein [Solirubrobacteraceae bacterium]
MRVGLDLLYLVPGQSGGRETYARELVPAMLERHPELELVAFVNRDAGVELAAELAVCVRAVVLPISAHSRAQWAAGELALVSGAARSAGVDVLHSMANFAPAWGRTPRVVTIHDLQYLAVPDQLSPPVRKLTGALMALAARGARRVIAVSEAGAQELVDGLGVERSRIDVVPNGVRPPAKTAKSEELRDRHRLEGCRIALCVATNLPHKNLAVLFQALARIAPSQRPQLVLAGHGTDDGTLNERALAAGVAGDVRLLGGCTTIELDALYALADCLVLPTLHEGFGLPVLEAMARSLPVACSDIAALREVAGPAAVYFDPRRPEQIAGAIAQLLEDRALAGRLVALGAARAAGFSWDAAAAGTLASYRAALTG